jgi:post-segregation antitoxin (ccd killing protein)
VLERWNFAVERDGDLVAKNHKNRPKRREIDIKKLFKNTMARAARAPAGLLWRLNEQNIALRRRGWY